MAVLPQSGGAAAPSDDTRHGPAPAREPCFPCSATHAAAPATAAPPLALPVVYARLRVPPPATLPPPPQRAAAFEARGPPRA
jgi:hypothetical protein